MQFCWIRKCLHWSKATKNVRNLEKFQNCLNRLKRGKHLDEDIYERIRPFAAVTPTLYNLPKQACKCRPVLASNDCLTTSVPRGSMKLLTHYNNTK